MAKSLNTRVEEALDAVNDAREAMDGARLQSEEIGGVLQKLGKASTRLRKLLDDVSEIVDELEEAQGAIDSELESLLELKLEAHVDALEVVSETLDDVSQLELETE